MRNHRGLKPFQLARANGHSSIARQLCDTRPTRNRRDRRRRTAEGGSGGGGGGGGGAERSATTPEALLTMLIQVTISNAVSAWNFGTQSQHICIVEREFS